MAIIIVLRTVSGARYLYLTSENIDHEHVLTGFVFLCLFFSRTPGIYL